MTAATITLGEWWEIEVPRNTRPVSVKILDAVKNGKDEIIAFVVHDGTRQFSARPEQFKKRIQKG